MYKGRRTGVYIFDISANTWTTPQTRGQPAVSFFLGLSTLGYYSGAK